MREFPPPCFYTFCLSIYHSITPSLSQEKWQLRCKIQQFKEKKQKKMKNINFGDET